MSSIDTQSLTAIHAETVDSLRITNPFVPHAPTYLSTLANLHRKTLRGRDLSTAVKRDAGANRRDAGSRIPRVREGGRARERNAPIAFHGPLRGSHVRRGGSGDVGVASGAYVTCAPCARRGAARRDAVSSSTR